VSIGSDSSGGFVPWHLPRGLFPEARYPAASEPPKGRVPHARKDGTGLTETYRHMAIGLSRTPFWDNDVPRHTSGLPIRARRPRPSEETALRIMPGFSPCGHPCWASPPRRGGLWAPVMRAPASPRDIPARPRPLGYASGRNEMPRHPYGLARRTHRVRPSEETPPRVISRLSRKASHPRLPPGGAGSARPQRWPWVDRYMSPLGRQPPLIHVVGMECLGASSASPCGRGDRAPPKKRPCALSLGFPPRPS